ncbi:hypothetical protein EDB84DRAFT_1678221 [Lactarius hengduanensis]|nr:hypothetical protein EDB84DRAFT_1678221 [Lactarius hengduanensis]
MSFNCWAVSFSWLSLLVSLHCARSTIRPYNTRTHGRGGGPVAGTQGARMPLLVVAGAFLFMGSSTYPCGGKPLKKILTFFHGRFIWLLVWLPVQREAHDKYPQYQGNTGQKSARC